MHPLAKLSSPFLYWLKHRAVQDNPPQSMPELSGPGPAHVHRHPMTELGPAPPRLKQVSAFWWYYATPAIAAEFL